MNDTESWIGILTYSDYIFVNWKGKEASIYVIWVKWKWLFIQVHHVWAKWLGCRGIYWSAGGVLKVHEYLE